MRLSVIIPTKNRANMLERALKSITNQSLSQDYFEVIVVDNGSIDNTRAVVESFLGKIKNLRYFYAGAPGLHVGRHMGLKKAIADITVFCDDDIEAFPTWLEGICESFEREDVVLVGGKVLPKFESFPPDWLIRMWEKSKLIAYLSVIDLGGEVKYINPYYVFGCNFAIRKKILLEAGGFHPDGMPAELIKYRGDGETYVSDFIRKKGYKTLYNPKASVFHIITKERMTKEYFATRAFNQGISDSYTDIRNNNKKNLLKIRMRIFLKKFLLKETLIEESYLKGYLYHQNEAKKDPQLMEWIKKENYLDSEDILWT